MMNFRGLSCLFCAAVLCLMPLVASARPVPQGLWEFDDPNDLLDASVGSPLVLTGNHFTATGRTATDGAVLIRQGSSYRCYHGIPGTDGGTNVNEYTIVMDVKVDSLSILHALVQTDPTNTDDAEFFIDQGSVGGSSTGWSTDKITQSQWVRIAIAVNLESTGGAVDIYVDGESWLHAEPDFWDVVRGSDEIHPGGALSFPGASSSTPYVSFFQDNDGGDGTIVVTSIALYDHALMEEEAEDLGGPDRPFLLPTVPGATTVTYDGFLNLPAGQYDTVFVTGVGDINGDLRLEKVVIDTPGVPTSIGEGYFDFAGQMIRVTNFVRTDDGYRASCLFQMPGFLGGMKEGVDFKVEGNVCTIDGGHFDLPDVETECVEIEKVFFDFHPDTGEYGGGGILKLETWNAGIGGEIELKAGLGPEICGVRLPDVTKIELEEAGVDIEIGEVFAIHEIGGGIENEYGLSDPLNWLNSKLDASMMIVIEPSFTIGGRTYYIYALNVDGSFSIHDGSLDIEGTGLLMNTIETNTVHAHYDPPYYFDVGATFNALDIFIGSLDVGVTASGFHGDLNGTLGIPASVPVVGGWTFADASAHVANTVFEGSLDVVLVPAIPSICTPQICFPTFCIGWFGCDSTCWAWIFPYPCNCYWHTACWTPPCIPPICTPAIPAITVHFGFKFDATAGTFNWEKKGPYNPWEVPIEAPVKTGDQNGGFYVLTNWYTVDSASTNPVRSTQKAVTPTKDGGSASEFYIGQDVPAALFRLNYENTGVTEVDMTVTTPGGANLNSADGALPIGFGNNVGYSRFNADASEEVIVLIEPAQGTYQVTVNNEGDLGNYTVDLVFQDALPYGEITSITPGEDEGEYEIAWDDYDAESSLLVRIFLDHDREGSDGFLITTIHESSNTGTYTLQTSALDVHAGDYFVRMEVDDGVNAPYSFHSDDTIQVVPTGAPEPVTNIKFLPDDGRFHISWDASPTPDLLGYLVLYKYTGEDLGHFNKRYFVPVDVADFGATIDGLENGRALLATVVAVDQDHRRSYPAEIVRIVPQAAGATSSPRIVSEANPTATATYAYSYLPTMSDTDFGTYLWTLDLAPAGMSVDAACGLVTWTPTEAQEGEHDVILTVTKDGDNTLFDTQWFTVHVYPPHQVNGLEEHGYQVASAPASDTADPSVDDGSDSAKYNGPNTVETAHYEYQVRVHGPSSDLHFELVAGPDGMTIDADTGLITWDVPAGAKGDWVRVLITAEGKHRLEHDYYLHVRRASHFPSIEEEDGDDGDDDSYSLFGCQSADASTGSGSAARGLGEFVVLAFLPILAWCAVRWRRRRYATGREE